MFRYIIVATNRKLENRTYYVRADDRDQAVNRAFDDMGAWCISSCRKISGQRLKD